MELVTRERLKPVAVMNHFHNEDHSRRLAVTVCGHSLSAWMNHVILNLLKYETQFFSPNQL